MTTAVFVIVYFRRQYEIHSFFFCLISFTLNCLLTI